MSFFRVSRLGLSSPKKSSYSALLYGPIHRSVILSRQAFAFHYVFRQTKETPAYFNKPSALPQSRVRTSVIQMICGQRRTICTPMKPLHHAKWHGYLPRVSLSHDL